jgi:hypothetical protein
MRKYRRSMDFFSKYPPSMPGQSAGWHLDSCSITVLFFKLNDRRKVVDDRPPHLGMHAHAAASEDDSSSCSWPQRVGGHQRTGDSVGGSKTASSLVQSTGKFFCFNVLQEYNFCKI